MKGNLLLINPWIYDFAAYDLWLKPLGLLSLASLLRQNQYSLTYLDCLDLSDPLMAKFLTANQVKLRRKPDGSGALYKTLCEKPALLQPVPRRYGRYGICLDIFQQRLRESPRPEAVLITSMMTYWYPGVAKVIELIREYDHRIPILLGGNFVTLCPEKAQSLAADVCLGGEGEEKVLKALEEITGRRVIYWPDLSNLDSLPYPAFDLPRHLDFLPLQTSRGCPFRCVYCASSLLSRRGVRHKSVSRVMDEIAYSINTYGLRHFVFYDDALCHQAEKYLIPLLKGIIDKGWRVGFSTPNALHVREITPQLAELFFQTGFGSLRLGLETADPQNQESMGGKVTNDLFERAIWHLHQAGFTPEQIGVYLLVGLPGQRVSEVESSVDYVLSCGAVPVLAEFSPIPGTLLWPVDPKYSPYDLSADPLLHNNSILPCQWDGFSWQDYLQLKTSTQTKLETLRKEWRKNWPYKQPGARG